MVVNRKTGALGHSLFSRLPDHLRPGDVLVVNDTRVLPARLIGKKQSGAKVEILLVRRRRNAEERADSGEWDCLARSSGRLRAGRRYSLRHRSAVNFWGGVPTACGESRFTRTGCGVGTAPAAHRVCPPSPLHPPERRRRDESGGPGAVSDRLRPEGWGDRRPTAGLHFTPGLLQRIEGMGVSVCSLTLHVGVGTFLPVKEEQVEKHRLEPEAFEVTADTAETVGAARKEGRRVIGVGTTVARALESAVDSDGTIRACKAETGLFILPGHRFGAVDGLITNFHLPRSTLLMLVSALAGKELILAAYRAAIQENYRFYSYGTRC